MSQPTMILSGTRRQPRKRRTRHRGPAFGAVLAAASAQAIPLDSPFTVDTGEEEARRAWITAGVSLFLHLAAVAILLYVAAITRVIPETMIPVALLPEEPAPPEAAPAPKALAERRAPVFNPAVQAVAPRVVSPRVVARAATPVNAQAIQMDPVAALKGPTQVQRNTAVVERVSAVETQTRIRATTVDVSNTSGPVVRGPVKVNAAIGQNIGPRQVLAARTGNTVGLSPVEIGGNASSVEAGIVTGRDVEGSIAGVRVANVDTQIGDGYLGGIGGAGTGVNDSDPVARQECFQRPSVNRYLSAVRDRTVERWVLPPGLAADQQVTLNFHLDPAGSATSVRFVKTSDNTLGASAADALRAAAPFPPMSDDVRCLAQHRIRATFTNPTGA